MKLDRRQLPPFVKLSYQFDIDKILEEYRKMPDINSYDDVDFGKESETSYKKLLEAKLSYQEDSSLFENLKSGKQLALTDYNGDFDKDIKTFGKVGSYKASMIKDSKHYHPMMDERNYTKRRDICTGYWNEILDTFKAPVTRTRLSCMKSGYSISPHIDYNTTYSIRIHIAVETNEDSFLCARNWDGSIHKIHMPANGSCYFLNTGITHWAENNGNSPRTHLIVALNGQDDLIDVLPHLYNK